MGLLSMILGCSGLDSKPKEWKKAKPLTERLDHPNALASDDKFISLSAEPSSAKTKARTM